jgi:long-chain fatty acid transport protein
MKGRFIKLSVVTLALALAGLLVAMPATAGGVDNKQNWSAAYAAGPSRNAVLEGADIAAYNPAGIMHLEDGLVLELDGQYISLNYDHGIDGVDYGIDGTALVPSLFGIYKKGKWAIYGTFTIPGGGGEVEYEDGNIITHKIDNALSAGAFAGGGIPGGGTLTDQYAYVESFDYGFTAGGSYAITEQFSISAGLRYVMTEKDVDIHGTYNIGIDIPLIGKYEQEADGIGGVLGLNYRLNDQFNFALRYETKVKLDWDTTIPDGTNAAGEALLNANNRYDGESYARDLPAVLGLGMEWKLTPNLAVRPSVTYYFEKDADWDTQNDAVSHNSYDLALSFAYKFNEQWSASSGYMYTSNGVDPDNFGIIEQMSPPLDCHTVALGGKYKHSDSLAFNLGAMGSFYVDETADATYLAPNVVYAPETEYQKTNYTLAVSIEYKFF